MPVKRRLSKQRAGVITPELVKAWRRAVALNKQAHLSPKHREIAYDAEIVVDKMLGTRLYEISVFLDPYFARDEPPDHIVAQRRVGDWQRAHEQRQQLREADRELRRQGS
jgi:hypothetical protein